MHGPSRMRCKYKHSPAAVPILCGEATVRLEALKASNQKFAIWSQAPIGRSEFGSISYSMVKFLGWLRKRDPSASLESDRVSTSTSQHDRPPRQHGKRSFLRVHGSSSQRKRSFSTSRSKNERGDASRQDACTPTPTSPTQPHDAPDTEDMSVTTRLFDASR